MNINIDIKSGFLFNLVFSSGLTLSRAGVFQRERERERKGGERTLYIEIISDRLSPAPPPSLASAALSQNPNLALRVLYLME